MLNGGFFGMGNLQGQNYARAAATSSAARDAASQGREVTAAAQGLERRVDKLALISMALWSLLSEKTGLREEDLLARIKKIDLLDGQEDGKLKKRLAKCRECGRVMSPRHPNCIYCGAAKLKITAFDDVV